MVRSFCCLDENATVNNAGLKFTRYKTWDTDILCAFGRCDILYGLLIFHTYV